MTRTNADRSLAASRRREALVLELSRVDVEAVNAALSIHGMPLEVEPPLGYGRCSHCRRNFPADQLEVDHPLGIRWDARRLNAWRRAARYWREYEAGVLLRDLCRSCNGRAGARRRYGRRALPMSRRAS